MRSSRTGNYFLDSLSPELETRLMARAKLVELPIGKQLCEPQEQPDSVWLLTSGIASFTYTSVRGTTIELATMGKEGVVGAFAVLGHHTPVGDCGMQLGGSGYVLPLEAFQAEFHGSPEMRARVLEFVEQQMSQAYQIVACNRLHKAKARFSRWLLMVQDRVEMDVLPMTQEFLADMLGTRRTTVVEVAGELARRGAIEYRRGVIRIADRKELESEACECYGLLKERFDRLYAEPA